jgi:hypothetical protein
MPKSRNTFRLSSICAGALVLAGVFASPAVFAQAASSPAKKELVARIVKLQQPGIEAMAHGLVQQPALELLDGASNALAARIPKDKQEAVARDIQADATKYVEETAPVVAQRAVALAPSTIGALVEQRFTEDELKQIVSIIESPVYGKFQQMGDEMQKALIDKLVQDTKPTVEPKVRALDASIAKRLGVSPAMSSGAGAGSAATPPKRAASR